MMCLYVAKCMWADVGIRVALIEYLRCPNWYFFFIRWQCMVFFRYPLQTLFRCCTVGFSFSEACPDSLSQDLATLSPKYSPEAQFTIPELGRTSLGPNQVSRYACPSRLAINVKLLICCSLSRWQGLA